MHLSPPPGTKWNGIAVYLTPNRYDIANNTLLAGPPGVFLCDLFRRNGIDPFECEYTDKPGLISGATKHFILGDRMDRSMSPNYNGSLHENRGVIYAAPTGGHVISTFSPVDCSEVVSHEPDSFDDDEDDDSGSNNKDSAPTQRRNFRFWARADFDKLLNNTQPRARTLVKVPHVTNWTTTQICAYLDKLRDTTLFLDIETHPPTNSVQCMSVWDGVSPAIVSFVCYDYRGCAHLQLPKIFAALAKAFKRNIVVGHNIGFDLGFLFHFHGVPFGENVYDTMLGQHRAFPEAEKSLAHTMSYWVNVPSHKSEAGTFTPWNHAQMMQLVQYNATDVAVLASILINQKRYGVTHPGYAASVAQANSTLPDYLLASFTGFAIDVKSHKARLADTEKSATSIERVLRILTDNPEFNPASGQQIGQWLYEGLGYVPPELTDGGAGKTDMKTLYKLLLKYPDNVALKLLLMFKRLDKVASMLGYEHYYVNEKRQIV